MGKLRADAPFGRDYDPVSFDWIRRTWAVMDGAGYLAFLGFGLN